MRGIKELYKNNENIKEYIDKYAVSNNVPVDVAFSHAMVHIYIQCLDEKKLK